MATVTARLKVDDSTVHAWVVTLHGLDRLGELSVLVARTAISLGLLELLVGLL
jgi:hypothetical protein